MAENSIELKLEDTGLPAGEIDLRDLAELSDQLQTLATRVGRWVAGIDRVGRSGADVEEVVSLRLKAIRPGSTVFVLERGTAPALFDSPLEEEFDSRLWETLSAVGTGAPRRDTPPGVRESAIRLLDAMQHAAGQVVLRRSRDRAEVTFRPVERDRAVWTIPTRTVEEREITVSGTVQAVDLASHKFRLHDDVGNRIPLEGIDDPEVARDLLGRRADAVGLAVRDHRGRVSALRVSSIGATDVPAEWTTRVEDEAWRHAPVSGPDPEGGAEFTDEEWHSLMTSIKGE